MMNYWQRQEYMFSDQEKEIIEDMVVFVGGAGGLGTHQAVELQRIGVKKIYLIDRDVIEATNLNRQILYGSEDIGRSKVEVAKEKLDQFNMGTEVEIFNKEIDSNLKIPDDTDLILDALDNYKTRYHLDELAEKYDLPLVHGAVQSWYGQITTIIPGKTPSLKDIFGERKESTSGEIPVFSPVVSMVANMQVVEGLKVLLGREDTLAGKLLIMDLTDYSFNTLVI